MRMQNQTFLGVACKTNCNYKLHSFIHWFVSNFFLLPKTVSYLKCEYWNSCWVAMHTNTLTTKCMCPISLKSTICPEIVCVCVNVTNRRNSWDQLDRNLNWDGIKWLKNVTNWKRAMKRMNKRYCTILRKRFGKTQGFKGLIYV